MHRLWQKFPSDKRLLSADCKAFLMSVASLWRLSIAHIECRHAALRRLLLLKAQTGPRHFAHLSADFLLLRARAVVSESLAPERPWEKDPDMAAGKDEPDKGPPRPGGGQRAFLANWWHHKKGTTKEGHVEYARILEEDGEEAAHWRTLGKAATAAAHAGNPHCFGHTKKEADRAKKRRLRKQQAPASPLSLSSILDRVSHVPGIEHCT